MAENLTFFSDETMYRKCGEICIGEATFYFSYSTIIAFRLGDYKVRRHNHWGPTTGKHFNHLYCEHFKKMSDIGFDNMLQQTLKDAIHV